MALYTELQFSEHGRLVGFKMLNYFLERSRVSLLRNSGAPFHIFGMLMAGASPEGRQRWRLDDAPMRLLGHGRDHPSSDMRRAADFTRWTDALALLGLTPVQRNSILDVFAAMLHLGNLEFVEEDGPHSAARVTAEESLYVAASLLGVGASALANAMTHQTSSVHGSRYTAMLSAEFAARNRDKLLRMLYALVFAWLNEHINTCFSHENYDTYVSLLDVPGWRNRLHNHLDVFAVNFLSDTVHRHMTRVMLERRIDEMEHEGLSHLAPLPVAADESERMRLCTHFPGGLIHIMDDQTRRRPRKNSQTMVEAMQRRWVNHAAFHTESLDGAGSRAFTVTHFHGGVAYDPHGWLEYNDEAFTLEHVSLLRGSYGAADGTSGFGSSSAFVRGLFRHAPDLPHATQAELRPARLPSIRRVTRQKTLRAANSRDPNDDDVYGGALQEQAPAAKNVAPCVLGELRTSLGTLLDVVDEAKAWFVLCVRPNGNALPNQCEPRMVRRQMRAMGVARWRAGHTSDYSVTLTYTEFCDRYGTLDQFESMQMLGAPASEAKMRVSDACALMNWSDKHVAMGMHKVFLSHTVFRELEDALRARDPDEMQYLLRKAAADDEAAALGLHDAYSPYYGQEMASDVPWAGEGAQASRTPVEKETASLQGTPHFTYEGEYDESEVDSLLRGADSQVLLDDALDSGPGEAAPSHGPRVAEQLRISSERRHWVIFTWLLTFWMPSFILARFRRYKRSDVRMAWREKLAINMVIWFICLCSIFVIVFLGDVVCPRQHVYSTDELAAHKGTDAFTAIRGEVFNLNGIIGAHIATIPVVTRKSLMQYAGTDATSIFPVQVNALCNGPNGPISPWVTLDNANSTDPNAKYHDFRAYQTNDVRPDWYYEQMWYMRDMYRTGFVGYKPNEIDDMLKDGRTIGVYNKYVYDLTSYVAQGNQGGFKMPPGVAPPPDLDRTILSPNIVQLMMQNPGKDVHKQLDTLPLPPDLLNDQRTCLRNLFFIGVVDERTSARCTFSSYILLAISLVMVATIGFKFFAALQFTKRSPPEEHDKFVICQVPCYTEDTDSMRKTIDSIARLRYDDRRKLIVVICDGNIVGAGNDAPTPELVLELLGADTEAHVEPRSFLSLGEGTKQHNMAKVYSGLYEHAGHLVPYLVIAKCGRPEEHARPGNRGKRDSQLILMRFLNKVHFGSPMSPLELEMYHHIKNIIGVNPTFYEYLLQVDADTEVEPAALGRMIAAFVRDKKVIGMCGETALANEQQSIMTMLQVYEYYISHYMVKAFESLFGSITCLPGCFSMFRLRAPDTHRPLFVSNAVVDDYSENRVDTLHLKNLLYLGEDRYLTTLVLKHFPDYKTQFIHQAKCWTTAPDSWKVLLSQRRRWINSTVHNLVELLKTPQLCGFCLFSMRFIVMIDLLSTIIAPVTIGYLVYLVIVVAVDGGTIPLTSIVLLCAIYGLQAIIFILHRRFDMIGWMVVYICGLPLWALILPLYSFWHMDDFSWGNTRIVTGEHGEKLLVHNEGHFDPSEIPHMTWEAYENQLWEHRSQQTDVPLRLRRPPSFLSEDDAASMLSSAMHAKAYQETPWADDASLMPMQDRSSWLGESAPEKDAMGAWGRPAQAYQEADLLGEPMAPTHTVTEGRPPHGRLPPNEIIRLDIRRLLAESDLTTVTKRQMRARLQDLYGCSIEEKKSYINAQIETALREM
ncbi:chitin synthase [Malassezia pachydermatis]